MDLYIQKFGKKNIVELIGWNKRDAILKEVEGKFKFAVSWNLFLEHYELLETFDCDVDDYEGADLTNR